MQPRLTSMAAGIVLLSLLILGSIAASDARAVTATPFTITWTAPGDDSLTGRATSYDLRYSSQPLTAANFLSAQRLTGLPLPAIARTLQSFVVTGLADGTTWYLALRTVDDAGNWSLISNVIEHSSVTTGVTRFLPQLAFSLPRPNPARSSTRWSYELPQAARVRVDIFDAVGRHVRTVTDGERDAGANDIEWDLHDDRGAQAASGIYFVRASLGKSEWTHRLLIVH